jgi:hypothetical protein
MKLLKEYFALQAQIFEHFGYVENWRIIPLDDCTEFFWKLNGESYNSEVLFHETDEAVRDETGEHYVEEIYTQRFLKKWVYRAENYTMVVCNTQTDGNILLCIFDNTKEIID